MRVGRRLRIIKTIGLPFLLAGSLTLLAFALSDDRTDLLLLNTLKLAFYTGLLSVPTGMLLATAVFVTDLPGRRYFQLLMVAWLFMPAYLQVAGWTAGFGLQGWFSRQVLLSEAVAVLDGWRGAVFIHAIVAIPWVTLIIGSGLQAVPRHLAEQAQLDSKPWQLWLFVALPLTAPSIAAAGLWVLIMTSCEVTITDVFQIRTYAEEIYTGFALGDDLGEAQIRSLPGAILIVGLCATALLVCRSVFRSVVSSQFTTTWQFHLRGLRWPLFAVMVTCIIFLVGIPIGNLIYKAGIQVDQSGDQRFRSWSALKFAQIMATSPGKFAEELAWSALLGQLSAVTVLAAALPLAWIGRYRQGVLLAGWTLAVAGLAIPGPIVALGLGRLISQPDSDLLFYLYDRTILLPWLTLVVRSFPFAFLLSTIAVQRFPQELLDSSSTDGARSWAQLVHIFLPQSGAAVVCILIVAFAIATADLSASILAVPPGVTTVAIRTFNLVHYGVEDYLAGLCLITMLIFAALAAVVLWLAGRQAAARDRQL